MNILHFIAYPVTPHIETDLELIYKNMQEKHNIKVAICKKALYTCFNNPYHKKSICTMCIGRILNGLKKIKFPKENIIFINNNSHKYLKIRFNNVKELMDYEYDNVKIGKSAASSLISLLNKDHEFDTIENSDLVDRSLNSVIMLYDCFKNILTQQKYDSFIFFNGRISEFNTCVNVCNKLNQNFQIHERSGTIEKYILLNNMVPQDPKVGYEIEQFWNDSPDPEKYKIAEQWYIDRKNGITKSWFSFTKDQNVNLLPENFDPKKENIAFFDSTLEEFYIFSDIIINPIYSDFFEALEKICESLSSDESYHIYFRVHPNMKMTNNTQVRKYRQIAMKYKNLTLIEPESPIFSYNLLDNCKKIITFSSTMGIEGTFWNKPVILINKTYYSHLDVVYKPVSHNELINLLKMDLKPKDKLYALMYSYWELNRGIKYELFKAHDFANGDFMGKRLGYPLLSLIIYSVQKLIEKFT